MAVVVGMDKTVEVCRDWEVEIGRNAQGRRDVQGNQKGNQKAPQQRCLALRSRTQGDSASLI